MTKRKKQLKKTVISGLTIGLVFASNNYLPNTINAANANDEETKQFEEKEKNESPRQTDDEQGQKNVTKAIDDTTTDVSWFEFDKATQTIVQYSQRTEAPRDIVIPNVIDGVEVLHIGENAFAGQQLMSVVLPSNL